MADYDTGSAISLGRYCDQQSEMPPGSIPLLAVFLWHTNKKITPLLVPSPKKIILDLGVAPNYEVTNLPPRVEFDPVQRVIRGKPTYSIPPVETYAGVSDILIKSMFGELEETYRIAWCVTDTFYGKFPENLVLGLGLGSCGSYYAMPPIE